MIRTTPSRPVDVAGVLPQLGPLARTATRLHPRLGAPTVHDSSVGGPLLWPAAEPWPHCDQLHPFDTVANPTDALERVRLHRRIRVNARGRSLTAQEQKLLSSTYSSDSRTPWLRRTTPLVPPWKESVAMLPVAQLYARDVPDLPVPAGMDLLQVLWCPFDHDVAMPKTAVFWRSAESVAEVLDAPPEPAEVESDNYVPNPCIVAPEQVTEYPHELDLSGELRELIADWDLWREAGVDLGDAEPRQFYVGELATAPGWKVGGWPTWGFTDPVPQSCPACGARMNPLLTIDSFEWDGDSRGWIPYQDQAEVAHWDSAYPYDWNLAGVQIASGQSQQLYVCPVEPTHPHTELMQ
ncbi:hypothetical protein ACGFNU_14735 [Spirillospora sp. NPDC048911]|uniref:hypothetical protein n=1 Tax=Spirillospora sp. NPDC048911 TaxID=3364527 RepID=UPI0037166D6F